jgi:hypothetical protein
MVSFSGLQYYSLPALKDDHVIPEILTIELGIFAGRLYMEFEECAPLIQYINNSSMNMRSGATTTETIRFIFEWVSLRRRGQDIMHTPIGYICQGRPLGIEHPFFVSNRAVDSGSYRTNEATAGAEEGKEKQEIQAKE